MKNLLNVVLVVFLSVGFISANAGLIESVTVITFTDPSLNNEDPLFTVDFTQMKLSGGWSNAQTGLVLEIPCSGYALETSNAFHDAWFEMSAVDITSASAMYGLTGAGVINFDENGTSTDPLVTIQFSNGAVSRFGLGADEIFAADNGTITGSKILGTLSEERFAFSFANLAKLSGHTGWADGFTAIAAFTSSAFPDSTTVPEAVTLVILGLGAMILTPGRKKTGSAFHS